MGIESREQNQEIKKLGSIEVEKASDGRITRINEILLQAGDKIIAVQRHQRPGSFTKEQLLKSAPAGVEDLSNLDYVYDPEVTEAGAKAEENLLAECEAALGKIDLIATTPRKRGSEHKKLLQDKFPEAAEKPELSQLLDDSGLGLMGESFYGAYQYSLDETRKLFKPSLNKEARFGKGPYRGERKPLSYMEAWVKLGYMEPKNKWAVENPEELAAKTEALLEIIDKEKSYLITHEANCVIFHMLAQRTSEQLRGLLDKIGLPEETKSDIESKLTEAGNLLDLFKLVKQSLIEQPVKGFHYKKALISILEDVRVKSGNKGYGAISIYILRDNEKGEKILLEPAYDVQAI